MFSAHFPPTNDDIFRLAELQTEVELFRGAIYAAVDAMMAGQNVTLHASMIKLKAGRLSRYVPDSNEASDYGGAATTCMYIILFLKSTFRVVFSLAALRNFHLIFSTKCSCRTDYHR